MSLFFVHETCVWVCVCLKYSYRIDAFESMSISNKHIVHICREHYTICHMSFLLNRIYFLFLLIWQNSIKNWQRGKMHAWNEHQQWIFRIVFFFCLFFSHLNQCLKDGFYFTKSQNKQDKAFFIFQYEMYAYTLYIDLLFLDLHDTLTRNENLWEAKLNLILVSF